MTRRIALALFAAGFTGSLVHAADELPSADSLIDRYVEVTGGKANYEKRKTEIMTAKLEFPALGLSAPVKRYAAPDKYYSSIEMPGIGTMEIGYTDGIAWEKSVAMGPRIKSGVERAEAIREATMNSTANLRKLYEKITVEGVESVDGEENYKVVLEPKEGKPMVMMFQKKSGLVTKMVATAVSPMGEVPVEIRVADYKNFGGIWVPAKTTQKAAGQEFTITIEKVDVNPEIPAERFATPPEIKALAAKAAGAK
jgi:hypothetical protein